MSSLGDLFHALPAVHCLREQLPATIDWVVHDIYADLAHCFTDVDRVIRFPRSSLLTGFPSLHAELRARPYDLIIDMQGLMKSALVGRLAKRARFIGPSFQREGARWLYDEVAGTLNKDRHAVDECLDVVRHLKLDASTVKFPVAFHPLAVERSKKRVAMLPCSRRLEKNWTVRGFVEVGQALAEAGAEVVLVGGNADRETCAQIVAGIGGTATNLAGTTGLVELGGLLQTMALMVTVDSGPMHMAAAMGVPVVAIFGPTFPERTGPYGDGHRVIKQGEDLSQLSAAPVVNAALEMLETS